QNASHPLGVDVDHQGHEQDQATDQDLQEAVDVDVVEPVVQYAQHQQADDRVADAALPPEQAGAAHHHGGNAVEQVGIELVLLGAAEIGDAKHAGNAGTQRRDDHHRCNDQPDVHSGI